MSAEYKLHFISYCLHYYFSCKGSAYLLLELPDIRHDIHIKNLQKLNKAEFFRGFCVGQEISHN